MVNKASKRNNARSCFFFFCQASCLIGDVPILSMNANLGSILKVRNEFLICSKKFHKKYPLLQITLQPVFNKPSFIFEAILYNAKDKQGRSF